MNPGFPPAIPLGVPAAGRLRRTSDDVVSEKIRTILETRPGQVPWRPDFGCDLASLAGQPATAARISDAKSRIRQALEKWLPDVEIRRVDVRVLTSSTNSGTLRNPLVPVAETALLGLGVQAELEVHVEVEVPEGAFVVRTAVSP